jgi:hypothetical protein
MPLASVRTLCDKWGKLEKLEPCDRQLLSALEKQFGASSPQLVGTLTSEAQALRNLGRTKEAADVDNRLTAIRVRYDDQAVSASKFSFRRSVGQLRDASVNSGLNSFEEFNGTEENADDRRPHQQQSHPEEKAIPRDVFISDFFHRDNSDHGGKNRSNPPAQR